VIDSVFQTGQQVGAYTVLSRLGSGGMGDVYRARDERLGREVAIKVLPATFTADPDRRARFEREARVLGSLNNPHIAAIYGVEDVNGVPALILELVDGPTLAERIKKGPLPFQDVLPIARQITEALEAAHERGIVHRDLKPANIKLARDDIVKVLDFGLAKAVAGESPNGVDLTKSPTITAGGTREGLVLGTAAYMSPEQARGQAVDKRADIWAFGCVLYEMLADRSPFRCDTVSDTLAAVLEHQPDWDALPVSTSGMVRLLLKRCLEKNPRQRLHDIADARIEIDHELQQPSVDDAPTQSQRRSRWSAWILTGSALTLLTSLMLGSIDRIRRRLSKCVSISARLQLMLRNPSRSHRMARRSFSRRLLKAFSGCG
jgi:eukaryotic-like serine/threonine-protein kinase